MKIGIIGTGNVGATLARKLAAKGYEVKITNSRGRDGSREIATEVGATPVSLRGAVDDVEIIVLAVPITAMGKFPADLFDNVPSSVPVVDTSNYYPELRDPRIPDVEAGMAESVWVSKQLGRGVIKAFNNILAYSLATLGRPEGHPDRIAGAVAGDDVTQKRIVMWLMDEMGFDPVDAGVLADSWRQQPSTPNYCCDYDQETMRRSLYAAVKGEAPHKRNRLPELFLQLGPNPSHDEMVAIYRVANAV
jgi:predicted dinucleotide-binding enzyme